MRISTNQIYESGAFGIQNNQQGLFKPQNQLSTGRRVLTPEDDPVAAAQALLVSQSQGVTAQHLDNQGNAKSQLGLLDSSLGAITDLIQNVRERAIQSGSTTLGNSERSYIASELQSRFNELLALEMSTTAPASSCSQAIRVAHVPYISGAAPTAPARRRSVSHAGDEGVRLLQVSSARQMPVNVSGPIC